MIRTSTSPAGPTRVLEYDPVVHPLPDVVCALFGGAPLDRLHEQHPLPPGADGDQRTPAHSIFYDGFARVRHVYERILRELVVPLHEPELCVQAVPTLRIHYPGSRAVREFHRDSDYNHQVGIVNYWIPLTRAYGSNSMWLETEPDSGEFAPVGLGPGQMLQFDAVRLRHGNHANTTGRTRVSVDFRVLPLRLYRDAGLASVSRGVRLRLDDYYMLHTAEGEFRRDGAGRR